MQVFTDGHQGHIGFAQPHVIGQQAALQSVEILGIFMQGHIQQF